MDNDRRDPPARDSIYLVGDEEGNVFGLSFMTDTRLKESLRREIDDPSNPDVPRTRFGSDPSGVTSLFDPAYLAECAIGLPTLAGTNLLTSETSEDDTEDDALEELTFDSPTALASTSTASTPHPRASSC